MRGPRCVPDVKAAAPRRPGPAVGSNRGSRRCRRSTPQAGDGTARASRPSRRGSALARPVGRAEHRRPRTRPLERGDNGRIQTSTNRETTADSCSTLAATRPVVSVRNPGPEPARVTPDCQGFRDGPGQAGRVRAGCRPASKRRGLAGRDALRAAVRGNGRCGRFPGPVSPILTRLDEVMAFDAA